jgi:hypothetical protein
MAAAVTLAPARDPALLAGVGAAVDDFVGDDCGAGPPAAAVEDRPDCADEGMLLEWAAADPDADERCALAEAWAGFVLVPDVLLPDVLVPPAGWVEVEPAADDRSAALLDGAGAGLGGLGLRLVGAGAGAGSGSRAPHADW